MRSTNTLHSSIRTLKDEPQVGSIYRSNVYYFSCCSPGFVANLGGVLLVSVLALAPPTLARLKTWSSRVSSECQWENVKKYGQIVC